MLDILSNNPYRFLGVYANSATKELVQNEGKINAFLKVGKEVVFPLDLAGILPPITRTVDDIVQAKARLALANEQIKYALFWFVKNTAIDEVAFNHLFAGDVDAAVDIWEKKETWSSLQNLVVCFLIKGNYTLAFQSVEKLYTNYFDDFIYAINTFHASFTAEDLMHLFVDVLCADSRINALDLPVDSISESWRPYIKGKLVEPLINVITSKVEIAKTAPRDDAEANYVAACELQVGTKGTLSTLKELLSPEDIQYKMLADKIGLSILQCAINYYNNSDTRDAATKAMVLQKYALSVVVGKAAKDRCQENVKILQKNIDELPPQEVWEESQALKKEIKKYEHLDSKIINAEHLLNDARPHLEMIKNKIGMHAYYVKQSTLVLAIASYKIMSEIAKEQKAIDILTGTLNVNLLDNSKYLQLLKGEASLIISTFERAWKTIQMMDTFDMEPDFKNNQYSQLKENLKDICKQLGINIDSSISGHTPVTQGGGNTPSGCFIIIVILIAIGLLCCV